jgi:hypothetical protein
MFWVGRRYEPVEHTGTREERILGLLREWWDVGGGFMRMHATNRERARIERELLVLGVEIFEPSSGEEQGWIFGRDTSVPHGPRCVVEVRDGRSEVKTCHCDHKWKVWHEEGFEDGVGCEIDVDVYESMPLKRARSLGLTVAGTQMVAYTVDGDQIVSVKVGTKKEWIGPPRKTFSDSER